LIKKPINFMLIGVMTVGLAACNTNDKNDINDQTRNRVGVNTTNRTNDVMDVRNGRDDGIDHNGPLTEDYSNRNNSNRDLDNNLFNANRYDDNRKNNNDTISAYHTNTNSSKYPHTKAVLIQDAKYQYVPITSGKGNWSGFNTGFIQPYLQQNQTVNPPAGQAPAAPRVTQPTAPKAAQPAPKTTQPEPKQTQPSGQTGNNTTTSGTVSQYVQQVIDLTNEQRRKNGLPALKADTQLSSVAQKKAVDMQQNNYFSHTSPTYGSPFDMMRDFGVTYKAAGENIAQGQRTPQEVVTAWMNSEGHRENILSTKYTNIGVGFEQSGNHWSQMFIGK